MSAPLVAPPVPRGLCGKQAPEGGSCVFIKDHDEYALTGTVHSWAVKPKPKRIQMSRQRPWRPDNPGAVIVARPSKWGNPWLILTPGGRSLAVQRFEEMLTTDVEARTAFGYPEPGEIRDALAGRDLACWCPLDHPCHADVLLEIANAS